MHQPYFCLIHPDILKNESRLAGAATKAISRCLSVPSATPPPSFTPAYRRSLPSSSSCISTPLHPRQKSPMCLSHDVGRLADDTWPDGMFLSDTPIGRFLVPYTTASSKPTPTPTQTLDQAKAEIRVMREMISKIGDLRYVGSTRRPQAPCHCAPFSACFSALVVITATSLRFRSFNVRFRLNRRSVSSNLCVRAELPLLKFGEVRGIQVAPLSGRSDKSQVCTYGGEGV